MLGISYAVATTGFSFGSMGAKPVHTGIVVCSEMEGVMLAAYAEDMAAQLTRAADKRSRLALGRWKTIVQKLTILARIKAKNQG